MNIGTKLYTWINGVYVGKDRQGNRYYTSKKRYPSEKSKRWVIYNGIVEASKVPPHWHAWLHKMTNIPPINYQHKYKWQKDHAENKTGTSGAYYPSSHPLSKSSENYKPKKDYESWEPE